MNLFDPRHTPGPWSLIGGEILNQSMTAIGFVYGPESQITLSGTGPSGEVEAIANERLIIMAPELLREAVHAADVVKEVVRRLHKTPFYAEARVLEAAAAKLRTAAAGASLDPYFAMVNATGGVN